MNSLATAFYWMQWRWAQAWGGWLRITRQIPFNCYTVDEVVRGHYYDPVKRRRLIEARKRLPHWCRGGSDG